MNTTKHVTGTKVRLVRVDAWDKDMRGLYVGMEGFVVKDLPGLAGAGFLEVAFPGHLPYNLELDQVEAFE